MNETIQMIMQVISSLGFPIAMCIWFVYDKGKTNEEINKILIQMNETLAVIKDYIEKER